MDRNAMTLSTRIKLNVIVIKNVILGVFYFQHNLLYKLNECVYFKLHKLVSLLTETNKKNMLKKAKSKRMTTDTTHRHIVDGMP